MTANPFLFESKSGKSRYTRLFACISEEEDCYTVQVRLSNETKPEDSAWGEEIVDSFETASELVAALAGEFSIVQACSRSKSECTIINTAPDTDPVWHVGRARLPFGTSRQSCCRFERTITHMPFARSSGGARIMALDASSYSKVAAGLPTSTSIFGFGPRVQRMSDVGRFVPLGPLRCRRSP